MVTVVLPAGAWLTAQVSKPVFEPLVAV